MKIAVVNYAYADDLADPEALLERYTTLTRWAESITPTRHVVSVVQRFRCDARLIRNGVEYVFRRDGGAGDPRSRLWPRRVHRAAARLEPDIVHVNGLNVPVQTWLLRRVLPSTAALVVQDHGGEMGSGRFFAAADAFFFTAVAQADPWRRAGLIAASQSVYQVLEASTTLRPVDRVSARRESRIDGDPAILWVGRLNANKDPLTILDGFERSLARLPGAALTMVYGEADLLPDVSERIRASPALASRVRLVGAVPHDRMASFYSAADLFVLGSHHEGGGYALLEACACGLPPVVTDIPPFRVITGDGTIGALWPVGEAFSLSDALVKLAARSGPESRQHVLAHFHRALSWDVVARQATDGYADVLAKRARQRA